MSARVALEVAGLVLLCVLVLQVALLLDTLNRCQKACTFADPAIAGEVAGHGS